MKKITNFISALKKHLIFTVLAIVALTVTAGLSYRVGQQQATSAPKASPKSAVQLFNSDGIKEAAKRAAQSKPTAPASTLKTSSGFYRLSGTVTATNKNSITLKLTNSSRIVLTTKETTNYYDGKTKLTLTDLKKNMSVIATGTVASDGTFTVTTIQKVLISS